MIGKGKFFDPISRLADDINNPSLSIPDILRNEHIREEKAYPELQSINSKSIEGR